MRAFVIPSALRFMSERSGRTEWLEQLPGLAAAAAEAWGITIGAPFEPGGMTAWVAPARRRNGEEVVLKIAWPHPEAEGEVEGLGRWSGDGAIICYDHLRLEGGWLLLLERCRPGAELRSEPETVQDEVLTSLLRRLWRARADGEELRPLAEMCDQWAEAYETAVAPRDRPVIDTGLARAGLSLLRQLPRTAPEEVLLFTDLHAGNILSAQREPWLAIDPKPYRGDPCYDVSQHLLNCQARVLADPAGTITRVAGLAGLDPERVSLWLFVRAVESSPYWPGMDEVARLLAPG